MKCKITTQFSCFESINCSQVDTMATFLAACVVLAMVSSSLVSPAAAQPPKMVFAHYMIYYPDTIDTYKQEIQLAKSKGIDAFALNTNIYRQDLFDQMYDAADQLNIGFKLFFSADIHCCDPGTTPPNDRLSPTNIISMLSDYRTRPSQLQYNGQSFFTSWGGSDSYWQSQGYGYSGQKAAWDDIFSRAGGKSLYYYLPFYATDGSYYGVLGQVYQPYGSTVDGYYGWDRSAWNYENNNWNTPITTPGDTSSLQVSNDNGKTYMAMVSPWFFKNTNDGQCCPSNNAACDPNANPANSFDIWSNCPCQVKGNYQGSGLWLQKWGQIISNPSPLVEIATWNDWFEGSYIAPPLSGGASSVSSFTHQAYLELGKHYIAWYKTGAEPVSANDEIYLFYYTQGSSVSVSGPPCGVLHSGVLSDALYVVVVMKPGPAATITLNSGGASNTISTGSQTQGVYVTGMGFQTGTQSATYTRGSVTYTITGGMPISNSGLSSYNFNVYSTFCANVQNGACGIPENQNS